METKDHISVCVCTYKRPQYLKNMLNKMVDQKTYELLTYSVVVVDNDHLKTAESTVLECENGSHLSIDYYNEPVQNISLARNKAVNMASGNLVAFIDDDEFPENDWLFNLYKTYKKYNGDGVLGPVIPFFEGDPPKWILKGKFCQRPTFETGTILRIGFRTGNVLLKKEIFCNDDNYFDPKYGLSGGEDHDFFTRAIKKGFRFVWCNEAIVYEHVPVERWRRTYYLKRFIRQGGLAGEETKIYGKLPEKCFLFTKYFAGFFIYTAILPLCIILGQHFFMKYLIKSVHNMAWIMAFFGIVLRRNKNE